MPVIETPKGEMLMKSSHTIRRGLNGTFCMHNPVQSGYNPGKRCHFEETKNPAGAGGPIGMLLIKNQQTLIILKAPAGAGEPSGMLLYKFQLIVHGLYTDFTRIVPGINKRHN